MSDMMLAPELEFAPEPPPKGVRIWMKDNLFSTPASSIMTIVATIVIVFAYRGLLTFVFNPRARWDAVTFNMKLLMVQAYPSADLWRVWGSLGFIVILAAASFAVWKIGGMAEPRNVGRGLMGFGGVLVLGGLLSPFSSSGKIIWIVAGIVFIAGGWALRTLTGARAKEPIIPVMSLIGVALAVIVVVIWTVELPWPGRDGDGAQIIVRQAIATSTTGPWTIIFILAAIVYVLFRILIAKSSSGAIKGTLTTLWMLSFPVLLLIVLRDPDLNISKVTSLYLPVFVGFSVVGWLVVAFASRPKVGEIGRVLGAFLLVLSFVSFAVSMPFVVRFLLLALALFTLAAPTFGGEGAANRKYLFGWLATVLFTTVTAFVVSSESLVDVPGSFFLGGLSLTIVLAFTSIVLSFPLGVILALGRTSTMPIFRLMSTTYIELVRGVPLITWLLVAFLMLPVALPNGIAIGGAMRAIGAMTLFSAAYLAENVRGGLQSIHSGQREAARALGMSTLQETVFITLPQALRAVIPALVGQVIALFKDTSLVTIVGLFDFLHMARAVIPAQSQPFSFLGSIKWTLVFAAIVYWMFTFTFSRVSQRLEKKLGVGER
ncbi:ABC transporter, permease protein (cluster 3, basic aa/glutamine/opines) [hydrothermal vent metagenome]|uniref:ABC transporter, permease protein (Cluster 3, basic aa/glutamine/opines) n=1 Tax=hydrothermal vent metagenome TaxID=652676 RepID=A0A3B0T516_9ZZZZ